MIEHGLSQYEMDEMIQAAVFLALQDYVLHRLTGAYTGKANADHDANYIHAQYDLEVRLGNVVGAVLHAWSKEGTPKLATRKPLGCKVGLQLD